MWLVSAGGVGCAARMTKRSIGDKHVPLMGVTAAFVFAAQMVNFPVAGGTSGHFMGAALAAILLGPWCGLLVMSSVLAVQCLMFSDGGLTALGANVFNMGIVGSFGGYSLAALAGRFFGGPAGRFAAFSGAWASIVLAACACALELAFSGAAALKVVLPAMAGVHAVIGVGEGVVTVLVLESVARLRPDLLRLKRV